MTKTTKRTRAAIARLVGEADVTTIIRVGHLKTTVYGADEGLVDCIKAQLAAKIVLGRFTDPTGSEPALTDDEMGFRVFDVRDGTRVTD